MSWGHRIVRLLPDKNGKGTKINHYGICEVYFNQDGSIYGRTDPITVEVWEELGIEDGRQEIIDTLTQMLNDAKKHPVLEEPIEYAKPD